MAEKQSFLQLGKSEEEVREKKKKDRIYGDQLRLQINENLEQAQLEKEERYRDAKLMSDLVRKIQLEDMAAFKKNQAMKKELLMGNLAQLEDIFSRRNWEKERKLVEELRVSAFIHEKAERVETEERRRKDVAKARDLEIEKLCKRHERARDVQAEKYFQDEQKVRRAQEDSERKWRKSELDEAFKLAQDKVDLRNALDEQVDLKDSLLAAEQKRSQEEFHCVLHELVSSLEKERKEVLRKKEEDMQYGRDLKTQIRENEKQHMAERRAILQEGEAMHEEGKRT